VPAGHGWPHAVGGVMVWDRRSIVLTALGAAAVVVLALEGIVLLANTGSPVTAPVAHTATPAPTRPPGLTSPFTGEPVTSLSRVLAVKIGNTVPERPPTGLTKADIVYLIPVEGGLSRILAIFSSRFPPKVGPVRSARADDLQLLRQFGRPAFAYSGAQPQLLPVVEHARIVSLYDGVVGGYFRSTSRVAPYNLYAHTKALLAEAPHASRAHSIGFRFGPPPPGGTPAHSRSVSYPAAKFRFTWSPARGQWLVRMDGARAMSAGGGQLSAPTVVIQYTTVSTSRFLEEGARPPYAMSIGSGLAVVLRAGELWHVRWTRPTVASGTTFTTVSGQPMTFARGQVWIVFAYR
jgi:Protein of unknown function (DUF3048) N-terminal domain/Protein of unknown function (DUF3048) C-terminal domain